MLFAEIIPVMRTPLGIEGFDYRVSAEQNIQVGDLVSIPFRKGKTVGLVATIKSTSPFATKALPIHGTYADIRLSKAVIELLKVTAARTFSSRPSVLKSWLRTLPKRPPTLHIQPQTRLTTGLESTWQTGAWQELIHRAIKESATKRVLVVTPWVTRAENLLAMIPEAGILHSDLSDGEAFHVWTTFLSQPNGCLITTKIGAWLAGESDLALLDEPEQDDHKQDELAPRYDARRLLLWYAQHKDTRVESIGLTPPLHAQAGAPTIQGKITVHVHHPHGRSTIPLLQANTVTALTEYEGPRIIIHPIQGTSARLSCRDCQWQASCQNCGSGLGANKQGAICRRCHKTFPMPETCPSCGGVDLSRSLPGIDRLQSIWQKALPETQIEWRDTTAKQLERPLPNTPLVVVTETGLLGAGEDIRRRERQCIAVRRLADRVHQANGHLILQCREDLAPLLERWWTEAGMKDFFEQERQERYTFGYPPAQRLVKIIIKGSEDTAQKWLSKNQQLLKNNRFIQGTWRGPFPAEHQPSSQGQRWIIHLVLPADTSEEHLIHHLTPCAQGAIIDLDPVAFLR